MVRWTVLLDRFAVKVQLFQPSVQKTTSARKDRRFHCLAPQERIRTKLANFCANHAKLVTFVKVQSAMAPGVQTQICRILLPADLLDIIFLKKVKNLENVVSVTTMMQSLSRFNVFQCTIRTQMHLALSDITALKGQRRVSSTRAHQGHLLVQKEAPRLLTATFVPKDNIVHFTDNKPLLARAALVSFARAALQNFNLCWKLPICLLMAFALLDRIARKEILIQSVVLQEPLVPLLVLNEGKTACSALLVSIAILMDSR